MKISIVQTDPQWLGPAENLNRAEQLLLSAPGADLYLLPEMFSTGFVTDPQATTFPSHGQALEWMHAMARKTGAAIAGSLSTADGESRYNRFFFVRPDGTEARYDKHHLFAYGGEDRCYRAGQKRCIAEYGGFRFLLVTCYDLRFPLWCRNRGDYDALLCVANWPDSRIQAWRTLLRARAIENQCYVAGANRTGSDPACRYNGCSALIDAKGNTLAEALPDEDEMVVTALFDHDALLSFRHKFPVLNDADAFALTP